MHAYRANAQNQSCERRHKHEKKGDRSTHFFSFHLKFRPATHITDEKKGQSQMISLKAFSDFEKSRTQPQLFGHQECLNPIGKIMLQWAELPKFRCHKKNCSQIKDFLNQEVFQSRLFFLGGGGGKRNAWTQKQTKLILIMNKLWFISKGFNCMKAYQWISKN